MGGIRSQRASEQILVLNATPIIYLCRSGLADGLKLLKPSFRFVTSEEVYEEVYTRGVEKGVKEVSTLKRLFEGGVIEVLSSKGGMEAGVGEIPSAGVHGGEISVISLALELGGIAIIDDRRARQVSRTLGARVSGTPTIIIELVKSRVISKDEAKRGVEEMVREGWYCSAKAFSEIVGVTERA